MKGKSLFRSSDNLRPGQGAIPRRYPNSNDNLQSPPPLPPRPDQSAVGNYGYGTSGYNDYSSRYGGGYSSMSPFNNYCNPMYGGGLSSYGGYGFNRYGYGGGYGSYGSPYGYNNGAESDFIRAAEDSSRQAFQSVESLVHAFGSISMMLESTYFALHSSFRAILGVADHFSRLRTQLFQICSSLALIKTIQLFIKRVLYLIGLRQRNPNDEAWSESASSNPLGLQVNEALAELAQQGANGVPVSRSSWPIILFFGLILGTPYLIWRLLSRIVNSGKTGRW